jgi:nitrogen regulatory protein PII
VNSAALQLITKDVVRKVDEEKMEVVKSTSKYDMVLAIINQGHVNELMEAARGAGARGGTVLHGRKVGVEEEAKFLGISVQLEKDIVSILVNHEQKNDVMRAITQACGISTESQGVVIALPVDEIDGLGSVKVDSEAQQA